MVTAYETIVHKNVKEFVNPSDLIYATMKHEELLLVRTYVHIIMIHLIKGHSRSPCPQKNALNFSLK